MDPNVRLIAFDVDGTLVENEHGLVVWQLLNHRFVGDEGLDRERYKRFLDGDLTYPDWVALDVEGWRAGGANRGLIEAEIERDLRLVPHARHVVAELAARGYLLAVVSGTLDIVLDVLFPDHPFHHVFTNRIGFDPLGAICSCEATPYDMEGKAEALRRLSSELGFGLDQVAFIGDNINDCPALRLVGCPIAYDPKHQSVRDLAHHVLPRGALSQLLHLFPARH
jgi:HAD superfamily phosphoserine phosphatase-like hydrolase